MAFIDELRDNLNIEKEETKRPNQEQIDICNTFAKELVEDAKKMLMERSRKGLAWPVYETKKIYTGFLGLNEKIEKIEIGVCVAASNWLTTTDKLSYKYVGEPDEYGNTGFHVCANYYNGDYKRIRKEVFRLCALEDIKCSINDGEDYLGQIVEYSIVIKNS